MAPPKKHTSHDLPCVKGSRNDGSVPTAALHSIADISSLLPSGFRSSGKDVREMAISSVLAKLPSTNRDLPQSVDMAPEEARDDDEPPPMSLPADNDDGKAIRPPQTQSTILRQLAEISFGAIDNLRHGVGSGSDGYSDEDEEDERESSEEAGETEGDTVEVTEDDALEMANDVLRSDKLCQIEELNEAKTLSKTRQVLAKYHPKLKHVGAFQFSKPTWKHLIHMGVAGFPIVDFYKKVEDFLKKLTVRSEARARLLADQILIMIFLKQDLLLVQLLFPASTDPEPVVIVHEDQAIFIMGSVDYAITCSSSTADGIRKTEFKNHVGKLVTAHTLEKQDEWLATQFGDTIHIEFTMIEEQRRDHTGSKLERWEAQVIGEALAIFRKTGQELPILSLH